MEKSIKVFFIKHIRVYKKFIKRLKHNYIKEINEESIKKEIQN
jgi:hypothetical protein